MNRLSPPALRLTVSPLPPVRSGVADYARDLLPHVARDFDVELFVDDRHPLAAEGRYCDLPVHPGATEAASRLAARWPALA